MGTAIIQAITSGLGLMQEIASQFLTGFSTLFWDATANASAGALTNFGIFTLVFLGIGVVFMVVKLVIGMINSKRAG